MKFGDMSRNEVVKLFSFDRFEALRASKGITKKYIADALNRTPTLIQDWKSGKSAPNKEQLRIVSNILGTTPEYLSGETDEKTPPAPKSESGRREADELETRFMNAVQRLPLVQKVALVEILEAAVRDETAGTPRSLPLRAVSQAAPVGR